MTFLDDKNPGAAERMIGRALAEKYGYFEIPSKEVVDFHTQAIEIPAALFRNDAPAEPAGPSGGRAVEEKPALTVYVKCENSAQYLGFAKYDFYILAANKSFVLNFVKGAVGLWMRLCVVIGIAVLLSTYLSGVIAWLCAMFLYTIGSMQDYIRTLVENTSAGGGPMEAAIRLFTRQAPVTQLDPSPGYHMAQMVDQLNRANLRIVQYVLPDVDRLDWTDYVARGFDISTIHTILLSAVLLAGYLLPWRWWPIT